MDTKNNQCTLKVQHNNETKKFYWEIWVDEYLTLKSDREYKNEYDCNIHLVELCNAFRYIYASKQIQL